MVDITQSIELTIVRHGRTDYNRRNIIQGQLNTQLDEVGQNQAQES